MLEALLPVAFAIFIWWLATGIVMVLDGLPRRTFWWSRLVSSVIALAALAGLAHSSDINTTAGAYCAFTCALLVWGWHELSFLTGWVTGPRRTGLTTGTQGWPRFVQAFTAILWHELAILATGLGMAALTWNASNRIGMVTFAVLWVMRISAKLNIFFGVRNLSMELLPPHLVYLGSYFRQRALNLLFPFAVTAATVTAVWMIWLSIQAAPGSAAASGGLLPATLLVLAIIEHWLLVLPLQSTALWRWAMRNHPVAPAEIAPEGSAATHAKLLHAQ